MSELYLYNGDAVSFKYNGGSNPGNIRNIYITKRDGDEITAWDFDKEEYRHFNTLKMTNTKLIPHVKYCDGNCLPSCCTIEQMKQGFKDDGYHVFTTKDKWIVAVKLPTVPEIKFQVFEKPSGAIDCFLWVGPRCIGLYLDKNGQLAIQRNGIGETIANPTVADLKKVFDSLDLQ